MSEEEENSATPEIDAIGAVHRALYRLESDAQLRVIRYVAELLSIPLRSPAAPLQLEARIEPQTEQVFPTSTPSASEQQPNDNEDGISPIALKWMRRSGLDAQALQSLFSLGIDEIDLVAKTIPGKSVRSKMKNVVLLKAIAAYLGTGVARVSDEQVREACTHYGAYDQPNFASHMKAFAAEIGGSKESGYNLTAKGIVEATELVKSMTGRAS